jgi:hypothetical protein
MCTTFPHTHTLLPLYQPYIIFKIKITTVLIKVPSKCPMRKMIGSRLVSPRELPAWEVPWGSTR